MKQMTFGFMQEESVESDIKLEDTDRNQLVFYMASAIIEVIQNQGEETDDK